MEKINELKIVLKEAFMIVIKLMVYTDYRHYITFIFFSSIYFILYILIGKEKLDGVKRPKTGGGPPLPLSHKERRHFCVLQMESHISLVYMGVLIQMVICNLIII